MITYQKILSKKDEKKIEEDKIAREEKETKLKQQYMNANKEIVEQMAWKGQQDGLEREIRQRQNSKLTGQEMVEKVNYESRNILFKSACKYVKQKIEFNQDYNKKVDIVKKLHQQFCKEDRGYLKQMHDKQYNWENMHQMNMTIRDEYKYRINAQTLAATKRNTRSQG